MSHIKSPQSILITAPHNLGDFVAKLPFIRLFKSHFPKCRLILLARQYIQPLVSLFDEVDEFKDFDIFFNRSDEEVITSLRKLNVEVCLHLLNVARLIGPDVLGYAEKAGIPYRLGNINRSKWTLFRKKGMSLTHNLRCPRILPHLHEFEWNLLPLRFFGIDALKDPLNWTKLLTCSVEKKDFPFLKKDQFNLILHPGSHGHAKEWPMTSFKELIKKLKGQANLIITGSLKEKYRLPLDEVSEICHDLRGRMSLKELIELIHAVDGIVAGSTGPIHLASLFPTKICALFPKQDSISQRVWGPKSKNTTILSAQSICLPCQRKLTDFNEELCSCMEDLSVDKVYGVIQPWLSNESLIR